ncbi:hypothetical protein SpAn4DRAFT_0817 [Sporomusa ovata]|uniref:Uncharacterized protein n=1 Tax=Sporomusa ovata TaxID=2378 RepID=A0A0U1L4C1_9FIRM|nr:hypothetical protein SpAn4DRAFT_0817 [Sporomusa ovata]
MAKVWYCVYHTFAGITIGNPWRLRTLAALGSYPRCGG